MILPVVKDAMWSGFDPDLRQQWKGVREMIALQRHAPTQEWPLVYVEEHDSLLVVREWPNGSMTSYVMSEISDHIKRRDQAPPEP
jgi:hypothetical protein